jgi:SAM-dependent methyltransferase
VENINQQVDYWDRVASEKEFTHPINIALMHSYLPWNSRILDYGCGYGRTCYELVKHGYRNVVGVDISSEMISRGREKYPELQLEVLPAAGLVDQENKFDAVVMLAVLTCIPTNSGQQAVLENIWQVLQPGGLIYISDYLLQEDERNQRRYRKYEKAYDAYGVFELQEGVIVRHHPVEWIKKLTRKFETINMADIEVFTMNGHRAKAFQYLGRK